MINISNLSNKISDNKSVFSDLDLALEEIKVSKNKITNDFATGNDLSISTDENAIKNSIRNILFQSRHLTDMNANLRKYIGEPISEFRGLSLGEDIERVLKMYEPRIKITKILVGTDLENSQYYISIAAQLVNLGQSIKINAAFNRNGSFNFINN